MAVTMDDVEYVSAAEAAARLATTEMRILMLIKQKALSGELVDGAWFVTAASLAGYRPAPPPSGPSCRTSCGKSACGCH